MMKKRLFALAAIAATSLFVFAACNNDDADETPNRQDMPESGTPIVNPDWDAPDVPRNSDGVPLRNQDGTMIEGWEDYWQPPTPTNPDGTPIRNPDGSLG